MEQFPVNLDMYVAVVGFFLPSLIAVVNRCTWAQTTKYFVSFCVVCIAVIGHLIFAGEWNVQDIPGSILKMLFMTIGSYLVFWRPSGLSDKIERNINPGKTTTCLGDVK
jgi:uncharacterized membrane protein